MKKVITAAVLVAFMGAVAFASMETRTTSKQLQQKQKKEQKEVKKKKECQKICPFSAM